MNKKILVVVSILLAVAFGTVYFFYLSKGYEGYWYGGAIENGKFLYREYLHFQKDSDGQLIGQYGSLDNGQYNKPLTNLKLNSHNLYYEIGPSAILQHLDWKGESLTGTAMTKGKEHALVFHRGMNFFMPRVGENGLGKTSYTYQPPQKLSDGWEVGDLRQEKGDITLVEDAVKKVLNLELSNVHSLVVVKKGKLVLDEYFYGYGPEDEHQLRSVSKSIMSALFGLAVDRGWVKTTDKLYDYFPEYRTKSGWDKKKNKITLGMILTMTSGLAGDDHAEGQPEYLGITEMFKSPDWLWYCLTQPMSNKPGKHWAYCGQDLEPLADILARKSGMSLPDYAQKYLYDPLGIQAHNWYMGPNNYPEVEGGHWLRPRDMAKVGLLYLQKGKWNGKQVISEKWIDESTSFKSKTNVNILDYGYLWWTEDKQMLNGKVVKAFGALGRGGQYILVIPERELILVATAGNYNDEKATQPILNFLGTDLLKAVDQQN